ncbi:MAG TPA: 7,8-didemethyl-8-hydroxy-5-deazariboflavin synthase CofG [Candidatus Margulisiibacteriota bacterium]|nr:7,8-didemethyl-8-hydroxy-5-deazariboflavin synthase CofG [Candidatus Margulisiibacteriota bacterium]
MLATTDAAAAASRLRGLSSAVRQPLEGALDGVPIDDAEALTLIAVEAPEELSAVLAVAGHLRTRFKGTVVTYAPKVFLPITNLCRDRCAYCTFRSDPNDPHAWTMLPEEIRACARQGRETQCIEALMCLGDKPELVFRTYRATLRVLGHTTTIDYVAHACEIALAEGLLPHTNAGLMSRDEMAALKPLNASMGLMLENVSPRLRRKGEAHANAPDKDPALRLEMMRHAGALGIPFTTGVLLGIGETRAEVVASLAAIRHLHRTYGHIQEIIIQNFRAKPTTRMAASPEPTSLEMARTIAVARLMVGDMNIQAPPNLSPYDHRLFLSAGINDWGGISPLTPDYVNPEAPWPHVAALAETCRAVGFTLQPRLPIYAEYVNRPGFLAPALRAPVARIAAERGVPLC